MNICSRYKITALVILFLIPGELFAQWKAGVIVGIDYNHYTSDNHYLNSNNYKEHIGGCFGLMGQYDFFKASNQKYQLGVRAECNMTQKNNLLDNKSCIINDYIQIPIMASCGMFTKQSKQCIFLNLGGYCGYKLKSEAIFDYLNGIRRAANNIQGKTDQRFDAGIVGSIGYEWRMIKQCCWLQVEVRPYFSIISSTKKYYFEGNKLSHYNTTLTLLTTFYYEFRQK